MAGKKKIIRREIFLSAGDSQEIKKLARAAGLMYRGQPSEKAWIEKLVRDRLYQLELNFNTPQNGNIQA